MGGEGKVVFAALVTLDGEPLGEQTAHTTALVVTGNADWRRRPYLYQVSENRALFYSDERVGMRYCDVEGNELRIRELVTEVARALAFCCLPIRLPDKRLLVAGGELKSTSITLITCGEEPRFEKIGDMPGEGR